MTLGLFQNFPVNVHRIDGFNITVSTKQLQQALLQTLHKVNRKEFSFEEITNPTVPQGRVIFEFGIADAQNFVFLNGEELKKTLNLINNEKCRTIDFFCVIRYYKENGDKKAPLKFDYYLLRTIFGKDMLEMQIFHERGPRYVTPEDLNHFVVNRINDGKNGKILKPIIN